MDPTPPPDASPARPGPLRAVLDSIRKRVVSGLLFMMPIVITFWILYWIYTSLRLYVLDPTARAFLHLLRFDTFKLPEWWDTYASPVMAAILAFLFLYGLGYFVRTRFSRLLDWILLRVPGVTVVYKAVRNLFQSIEATGSGPTFKRVVLVAFPHPGSRALAFVTKTMRDTGSGETILCVCVLTGVMPPSGFTFFVPEKDVIDVPWSVNDSLQIILSGGITAPALIPFDKGSPSGLILPEKVAAELAAASDELA